MIKGSRHSDQRGFTLIELAIVLVIIGIILGAILKGQDLIEGAKNKRIANLPSQWEVPIWAFYDRTGRFPGDISPVNGLIDTHDDLTTALSNANLAHPANTVGDVTVAIQSIAGACGGNTRNAMLFSNVPLDAARALDIAQDGTEDAQVGRVRSCGSTGTTSPTSASWGSTDPTYVVYFFDKLP